MFRISNIFVILLKKEYLNLYFFKDILRKCDLQKGEIVKLGTFEHVSQQNKNQNLVRFIL